MVDGRSDDGHLDAKLEAIVLRCLDASDPEHELELHAGGDQALLGRARRIIARFRELENQASLLGDELPERIGSYRILGEIGRGGMGRVYLAEQEEPVRRRVAVKLILAGLDSEDLARRFTAERQALARMSHPSIAAVHDAGRSEQGLAYHVMEFVDGLPITDFADRAELGIRERLELFVPVCQAVQHAHQKGVIHRDLKPSNVLVTTDSGQAVPKIIDFGIAKAADLLPESARLPTLHGQILGTPEYMSPEQAGVRDTDVDTRTDVYSLGAMLYELLTGALPFDAHELRRSGFLEMQRILANVEPPAPSRRVTEATRNGAAPPRGLPPTSLARRLVGDLDWILLKALEKDPARRYASAGELAADIERHLRHEPVLAGPPSTIYRLGKLVRRHRVGFAAVIVLLLVVAAGVTATWQQYGIARANERLASQRLEDYRQMRDAPLAQDLVREAEDELWPATAAKLPELRRWHQQALDLASRAGLHRDQLERLRSQALPVTEEVAGLLSRREQMLADAIQHRELIAKADGRALGRAAQERLEFTTQSLANLERSLDILEAQLAAKRYRFASYEDAFFHGVLAQLVLQIDRLVAKPDGLIADVERRIERAATLADRSIESQRAAWQRTIATIARADGITASQLYAGMPLVPQLGLVPLGIDPVAKLHEFAVLDTGELPTRGADGRLVPADDTAIVLVLIPPGRFVMGSQSIDPKAAGYAANAGADESPRSEVELEAFFLAKYELTQGQWLRITGSNPSVWSAGGIHGERPITLHNPVESVTWFDAVRALRRIGLVLPSEAQWEYAARAGTDTAFSTGQDDASLQGAANIADRSLVDWTREAATVHAEFSDGHALHAPVGSFAPNGFGLHDVHGNVWEWCLDTPVGYHLPARPSDGVRREIEGIQARVTRGGSWRLTAYHVRSAYRMTIEDSFKNDDGGLRPARAVTR